MDSSLGQLCRFFENPSVAEQRLALATILSTEGSTYRKAGASILIAADGSSSGLLSGGCLESDLFERAQAVMRDRVPRRVVFDTRGEDPVWGLGLGCEGAMVVWLEAVAPETRFGPLPYFRRCLADHRPGAVVTIVGGETAPEELGRHAFAGEPAADSLEQALLALAAATRGLHTLRHADRSLEVFVSPVELPVRLMLCGAGRDAIPLHCFAAALGWIVLVFDHRPAYANQAQFPRAQRVVLGRPEELPRLVDVNGFDAAVIMSHHLASDVAYLDCLTNSGLAYIGLLGPASRRARLLAELGRSIGPAAGRLYGPAGLDLGASTPEAIALSIVAQIHSVLSNRPTDRGWDV